MSLYPHQMKKLLGDVERRGEERKPYGTLRQQKNQKPNQDMEWKWNEILAFFFIPDLHPKLLSYAIIITPTHYTLFFTLLQPPCACMFIFVFILYPSILSPRARAGVLSPFLCAFFFLYLILTCSLGAWPEPYLPNDSMVSFFFLFFLYI